MTGRNPVEGVVAVIPEDGRLLVIRRAAGIRAGGSWCFPGGAVEPGESFEQAIVREIREELGLSIKPVRKLWEWLRPDGKLRLHWWLVEPLEDLSRAIAHPAEVAEIRMVTLSEFRSLQPALESNLLFLNYYEATCGPF